MKEIRHLKTIKKKKRNLNSKRHLLQNDQNADMTLLHSHDNFDKLSTTLQIFIIIFVTIFISWLYFSPDILQKPRVQEVSNSIFHKDKMSPTTKPLMMMTTIELVVRMRQRHPLVPVSRLHRMTAVVIRDQERVQPPLYPRVLGKRRSHQQRKYFELVLYK